MPIPPRIIASDDVYRLASWQNVAISEFTGAVDIPRIQLMARAHFALATEYPHGIVSCSIIRPGVPVGSQEVRNETAKFLKELGNSIQRSAVVLEDIGIMAQVLRTVVRGFNIITRNTKLVLCKDVDEAVGSLSPLVVAPDPGANVRAELADAIATVRKGYFPRPVPVRHVAQR